MALSPPSDPPRRDRDRERFELYRLTRDPAERAALVERFLPLARQLARRYDRGDEPFDDLLQVACIGLVKAIDRYEPSREVAFSSYAVPTITGELKRHFRDRTWSVRVPRDLQELALRTERVAADLAVELRRAPTVGELATALGVSEEALLEGLEAAGAHRATSLSMPRSNDDEDGDTLGDTLGADEEGFVRAEARATLDRLLAGVTPRQREVLRLRFDHDLTQAEIGAIIGVSQMQVSRILREALARLRTLAAAA